jgi:hypothetical protein
MDVLDMAEAETFVEFRQSNRNCAIRLLEFNFDVLQFVIKKTRRLMMRLLGGETRRLRDNTEMLKQDILDMYWSLRLVQAREAGQLPAWEGIRLVREFKEE